MDKQQEGMKMLSALRENEEPIHPDWEIIASWHDPDNRRVACWVGPSRQQFENAQKRLGLLE